MFPGSFSAMSRDRRQRHEEDVKQFLEKAHEKLDVLLADANIDGEIFYPALARLAGKWYGQYAPVGDCDGTRLMNYTLKKEIQSPLFLATVVDRLDLFISSFLQSTVDHPFRWLEVACICGVPKITGFLLGRIDPTIWSQSRDIVAYALSSGNATLAMDIALIIKTSSGTAPRYLYLYGFGQEKLAEVIEALFTPSSPPQNGL